MTLLDNLFNDSDTKWLKDKCPGIFTDDGGITYSSGGVMKQSDIGMSKSGEYYEIVENGNDYVKNLLDKEETYLKGKYGDTLYKYFIGERKKYIQNKINGVSSCEACIGNEDKLEQLSEINNIYKKLEKKEAEMGEKNNDDDMLNSRKFVYRSEIKSKIEKLNTMITYLYYFIISGVIIYLTINNQLDIKKKWYFYIIILMFPFLIFYIYSILRSSVHSISKSITNSGPKSAFLKETFV